MKKAFLFWCFGTTTLFAQSTAMGSRTMEGAWDASGAQTTKPARTGTALPAACSSGEAFFMTGAPGGQSLYLCKPDNTWTPAAGGARSISITDMAPVAADSGLILVIDPPAPIHLTRVYCAVQGGANVVLNLDKRAEGSMGADSGAHLLATDLTAVSGGATTSTFANGSSQCGGTSSCAVAAHSPVAITFTSVGGAPTALNCSVDYTVD
ncbi:MAG: hypothetical protein ABSF25_02305 [Bryobacteraceae bacterium]|jgi:hypothetical protein